MINPVLPPMRRNGEDYPRTKWAVAGYVLAHPRTWCLILGVAFAWQCFGLRSWVRHTFGGVVVEAVSEAHADH